MAEQSEDTGRESTYARESIVTGPYQAGLSAARLGDAADEGGKTAHPTLVALAVVLLVIVVVAGLVLLFTYL